MLVYRWTLGKRRERREREWEQERVERARDSESEGDVRRVQLPTTSAATVGAVFEFPGADRDRDRGGRDGG